jgi:hypothetical protein
MRLPISVAISLCFTLTSQARIGWTLGQCIGEYGPVTFQKAQDANQGTAYWFERHDPKIIVTLINNRVEGITYEKQSGADFYQPDLDAFSSQNLPDGAVWEKEGARTFASKDGNRVMYRTYIDHIISFYTDTELRLMYKAQSPSGNALKLKTPVATP